MVDVFGQLGVHAIATIVRSCTWYIVMQLVKMRDQCGVCDRWTILTLIMCKCVNYTYVCN